MKKHAELSIQQVRESIDISEEIGGDPDHVANANRKRKPIGWLFGIALVLGEETHYMVRGVHGEDPAEGHLHG